MLKRRTGLGTLTARKGTALVEYGILLILISVFAVTILIPFGNTLKVMFTNSIQGLNQYTNYSSQQINSGVYNNSLQNYSPNQASYNNYNSTYLR